MATYKSRSITNAVNANEDSFSEDKPLLRTGMQFTVNAADKVASLLAEEKNPNQSLRVYVTGGGCSGLQYGFMFDEKIATDDWIVEQICSDNSTKVKLIVDSLSYPYLKEAEIDYAQSIQSEQFVIRNPRAKTTCGCGSSFSFEEE